jgi:hypothetical protein
MVSTPENSGEKICTDWGVVVLKTVWKTPVWDLSSPMRCRAEELKFSVCNPMFQVDTPVE